LPQDTALKRPIGFVGPQWETGWSRSCRKELEGSLPTMRQIEAELAQGEAKKALIT